MNINNIAGNNSQTQAVGHNADLKGKYKNGDKKADSAESHSVKAQGDKLELSAEALKLQPVRQKIEDGFYDRPEVIQKVAEKIDDELRESNKQQ